MPTSSQRSSRRPRQANDGDRSDASSTHSSAGISNLSADEDTVVLNYSVGNQRGAAIQRPPVRSETRFSAVLDVVSREKVVSFSTFNRLLGQCNIQADDDDVNEMWAAAVNRNLECLYASHDQVAAVIVSNGGSVIRAGGRQDPVPPTPDASSIATASTNTSRPTTPAKKRPQQGSAGNNSRTTPTKAAVLNTSAAEARAQARAHTARLRARNEERSSSKVHNLPTIRSTLRDGDWADLTTRLGRWEDARKRRVKEQSAEQKDAAKERELDGCTFAPKLSRETRKLSMRVIDARSYSERSRHMNATSAFLRSAELTRELRASSASPSRTTSGRERSQSRAATPTRRTTSTSRKAPLIDETGRLVEDDDPQKFTPRINKKTPPRPEGPAPSGYYEAICRMRATPPRSLAFDEGLRSSTPPRRRGEEIAKLSRSSIAEYTSESGEHRRVQWGSSLKAAVSRAIATLMDLLGNEPEAKDIQDLAVLLSGDAMNNSGLVERSLDQLNCSAMKQHAASSRKRVEDCVQRGALHVDDAPLAKAALDTLELAHLVLLHSKEAKTGSATERHVHASVARRSSPSRRFEKPLRDRNHIPVY